MQQYEKYNEIINNLKNDPDFPVAYDEMRQLAIQLLCDIETMQTATRALHTQSIKDTEMMVDLTQALDTSNATIKALRATVRALQASNTVVFT